MKEGGRGGNSGGRNKQEAGLAAAQKRAPSTGKNFQANSWGYFLRRNRRRERQRRVRSERAAQEPNCLTPTGQL
eukprot:9497946-Pyramimonas_sp.AAC.1